MLREVTRITAVMVTVACAWPAVAASVRVRGAVAEEGGSTVSNAVAHVASGNPLQPEAELVINGRIDRVFTGDVGRGLTLVVKAKGYVTRTLNVDVEAGLADAGTIVMQPLPGLKLSKLYIYTDTINQRELVDVIVENQLAAEAVIETVRLQGTKRIKTECLDISPGIVFSFNNPSGTAKQSVAITSTTGEVTLTSPNMRVDFLPCRQVRLDYSVTYPFGLKEKETRIRINVPYAKKNGLGPERVALELNTWERLQVQLVSMSDGRVFSSSEK